MVEQDIPRVSVVIQHQDFDSGELQRELFGGESREGAVTSFTGYVRIDKNQGKTSAMELEHYPGMTEKSIEAMVRQAAGRWPIMAASVVHRVGRLLPGEQIVWVGVSSAHRAGAFSACEFIMDYLKAEAPLWKKEFNAEGQQWVEAKVTDAERARRWSPEDGQ